MTYNYANLMYFKFYKVQVICLILQYFLFTYCTSKVIMYFLLFHYKKKTKIRWIIAGNKRAFSPEKI